MPAVPLKSLLPPNLRDLEAQSLRGEIEVELLEPLGCLSFESVTEAIIARFAASDGPRPAHELREDVIFGPPDHRSPAVRAAFLRALLVPRGSRFSMCRFVRYEIIHALIVRNVGQGNKCDRRIFAADLHL